MENLGTSEGNCKQNSDNEQNSLDRATDDRKKQCTSVVFFPGTQVKVGQSRKLGDEDRPSKTHIGCTGENQSSQCGIDGIDAVVKQFTQGTALTGTSGLLAITRVESLIKKQTETVRDINPRRTWLIKGRVVDQKSNKIDYDKPKANKCNLCD